MGVESGQILRWVLAVVSGVGLSAAPPIVGGSGQTPAACAAEMSLPAAPLAESIRTAGALQKAGLYELAEAEWRAIVQKNSGHSLAPHAQRQRAICLFQLSRFAEAEVEFQRVIAQRPAAAPAALEHCHVNLGLAQYNRGRLAKGPERDAALAAAAATFEEQLRRFADGPLAPEAWYYRAEALAALGDSVAAAAAYQGLIDRFAEHPLRAAALHGLAVAQQESGQTAVACDTLRQFLRECPEDVLSADAHFRLGELLLASGRPADAEPYFAAAAAAREFSDSVGALERQAACRFLAKDFGEAANVYREVAARATDGAAAFEARHWLVQALLAAGEIKEALAEADRALAGRPAPPTHWLIQLRLDRADVLLELTDRHDEAAAEYLHIMRTYRQEPLATRAAYMATVAALETGHPQAALAQAAVFRATYGVGPAGRKLLPDVEEVAAEAFYQLGDYGRASEAFAYLRRQFGGHSGIEHWLVRQADALSRTGRHADIVVLLDGCWQSLADPQLRTDAGLMLGGALQAGGDVAAAAAVLATAADMPVDLRTDEVLLELSRAQRAAGDARSALQTIDRLIEDWPESQHLAVAYYYRGEFLTALGDDQAAIHEFAHVCDHWPASTLVPQALLAQAKLQQRQQYLASAAASLTRLLEAHEGHELTPQARLLRATVQFENGLYAEALADVRMLLDGGANEAVRPDALLLGGLCELKRGKPLEAPAILERLLREYPTYPAADRAAYELAWAFKEANQASQAMAAFRRLAADYPESRLAAECWYRVGEASFEAGDFSAALESFDSALRAEGETLFHDRAAHQRGWVLVSLGNHSEAEEAFAAHADQFPTSDLAADSRVMIGESRFAQRNYAGALTAFVASLSESTVRQDLVPSALLHGAQAAGQLEQWSKSAKLADRFLRDFPDSESWADAQYERGWAFHQLGRTEDAQRDFETVADRAAGVLAARARFMAGEMQFARGLYDDAVRSFFKVAYGYGDAEAPPEFHSWQAEAMFEAARCLEQTERRESARKLYRELLERFPESEKAQHARVSLRESLTR